MKKISTTALNDLANQVIESHLETSQKAEKKAVRTGVKAGSFGAFSDARHR